MYRVGQPIQNLYIESFNARQREECLNEHVFLSLDDARGKIDCASLTIANVPIRASAIPPPRSSPPGTG